MYLTVSLYVFLYSIYHQRAGKTNLFHMRGGRFHAGNTLCTVPPLGHDVPELTLLKANISEVRSLLHYCVHSETSVAVASGMGLRSVMTSSR